MSTRHDRLTARAASFRNAFRGVLICDIDVGRARDDNHLQDRRPDLYGAITE